MYGAVTRAGQVRALSGVAASVCMACDQLAVIGCESFASELLGVLEAIDRQIARLEEVREEE